MKFETSNKTISSFSFSSLTDIVLLLLIFFLLTSQFVMNNGVNLQLPKSNDLEKGKSSSLIVSIDKDGKIYLSGKRVLLENLETEIQKKKNENSENIIIQADKSVQIDLIIQIIDVAKTVGLEKFIIQTEKKKK